MPKHEKTPLFGLCCSQNVLLTGIQVSLIHFVDQPSDELHAFLSSAESFPVEQILHLMRFAVGVSPSACHRIDCQRGANAHQLVFSIYVLGFRFLVLDLVLDLVLAVFTFLQVFTSFYKFLQVFTSFYKFLHVFTSFTSYKFLQVFKSFYKFLQVFTSFHKFSQVFTSLTSFYKVFTSFYKFLQVFKTFLKSFEFFLKKFFFFKKNFQNF